jgi:hypothetical protein
MRSTALATATACATLAIAAPGGIASAESCREPATSCAACDPYVGHVEGEAAPGAGASFQSFDRPNIAPDGTLAFGGDTDGPTGGDDVLYVGSRLVAREGDPAPGVDGARFGGFEFFETTQQTNTRGDLVFIATLSSVPVTGDRAVYRNGELIALEGTAATGIAGRAYADFGFAGVADDGTVGFLAELDDPNFDDSVIYFGGTILYREGDAVPDLEGATWDGNFDELQWNGNGDLLVEGNTSLPAAEDMVLLRRRNTSGGVIEEVVAREGQAVDARDGKDALELILQTALADDGSWALRGNLELAPGDANAIILTEWGFTRQEGEIVESLPGVTLGNFNGLSINSRGDVLYLADLIGATPPDVQEGLFLNCCLLLTDGMDVPGLPDGTRFSDIGFEDLDINDHGQIVVQASYDGPVSGDGLFVFSCGACPGDLDADGAVGVDDLIALILDWMAGGPMVASDLNHDGVVDVDDLVLLILRWGKCPDLN